MAVDIVRAAEDIDQIDLSGNINQLAINSLPKDLGYFRIINGHRNNLKAGCVEILRNVKSGLVGLSLCFDAQHGDALGLPDQIADL